MNKIILAAFLSFCSFSAFADDIDELNDKIDELSSKLDDANDKLDQLLPEQTYAVPAPTPKNDWNNWPTIDQASLKVAIEKNSKHNLEEGYIPLPNNQKVVVIYDLTIHTAFLIFPDGRRFDIAYDPGIKMDTLDNSLIKFVSQKIRL